LDLDPASCRQILASAERVNRPSCRILDVYDIAVSRDDDIDNRKEPRNAFFLVDLHSERDKDCVFSLLTDIHYVAFVQRDRCASSCDFYVHLSATFLSG
jgi:hypothetical protein